MPGKTLRPDRSCPVRGGFNEAPAKCRGKPGSCSKAARTFTRFNEAPAKCRGKRGASCAIRTQAEGFNEAPAKCRGKRNEFRCVMPASLLLQ